MRNLLPLGTVVSLAGVDHRLMILGYARYKEGEVDHVYDYVGCYFPEGFTGAERTIIFDHSMINSLYYLGHNNEESAEFMQKVSDAIEQAAQPIPEEAVLGFEE